MLASGGFGRPPPIKKATVPTVVVEEPEPKEEIKEEVKEVTDVKKHIFQKLKYFNPTLNIFFVLPKICKIKFQKQKATMKATNKRRAPTRKARQATTPQSVLENEKEEKPLQVDPNVDYFAKLDKKEEEPFVESFDEKKPIDSLAVETNTTERKSGSLAADPLKGSSNDRKSSESASRKSSQPAGAAPEKSENSLDPLSSSNFEEKEKSKKAKQRKPSKQIGAVEVSEKEGETNSEDSKGERRKPKKVSQVQPASSPQQTSEEKSSDSESRLSLGKIDQLEVEKANSEGKNEKSPKKTDKKAEEKRKKEEEKEEKRRREEEEKRKKEEEKEEKRKEEEEKKRKEEEEKRKKEEEKEEERRRKEEEKEEERRKKEEEKEQERRRKEEEKEEERRRKEEEKEEEKRRKEEEKKKKMEKKQGVEKVKKGNKKEEVISQLKESSPSSFKSAQMQDALKQWMGEEESSSGQNSTVSLNLEKKMERKRVVVLGGGNAGLFLLEEIRKSSVINDFARVFVIEENASFVPRDALHRLFDKYEPLESFIRHYDEIKNVEDLHLIQDVAIFVDTDNRVVHCKSGSFRYDYLVISSEGEMEATLSQGENCVSGMEEACFDLFDTSSLYNIFSLLPLLSSEAPLLVFVPQEELLVDVLLPFEFVLLLAETLQKQNKKCEIQLLTSSTLLLPSFPSSLNDLLTCRLTEAGVSLSTGVTLSSLDPLQRELKFVKNVKKAEKLMKISKSIKYGLFVTAFPRKGPSFLEHSGLLNGEGLVPASLESLRVEDEENIFVLGDCAKLEISKEEEGDENSLPKSSFLYPSQAKAIVTQIEKSLSLKEDSKPAYEAKAELALFVGKGESLLFQADFLSQNKKEEQLSNNLFPGSERIKRLKKHLDSIFK